MNLSLREPPWRPSQLGGLGARPGQGWYTYDNGRPHRPDDEPVPACRTYVLTNITGVWALLDLRGARFYAVDNGGHAIVQLTGRSGTISIGAAHPPAVTVARLISFLGLALLIANLVLIITLALHRLRLSRHVPAGALYHQKLRPKARQQQ